MEYQSNKSLNTQQKNIINANFDQPILIVAGPGSGKTMVTVERIIRLANEFDKNDIYIFTFTNASKNNIQKKLINNPRLDWTAQDFDKKVKTFHAFSYYFAKKYLDKRHKPLKFAVTKDFAIKNTLKTFCKNNIYSLNVIEKHVIDEIIQLIKNIKIQAYLPEFTFEESEENLLLRNKYIEKFINNSMHIKNLEGEEFVQVFEYYKNWMRRNCFIDFEDSLIYCLKSFKEDKALIKKQREKIKYIFVDEFQDTNNVQFQIIYELAKYHKNIFCVGDPNQSIFGFSGSSPKVFEKYRSIFSDCKIFPLTANYRSTKNIIELADKFISTKSKTKIIDESLFAISKEKGKINFFVGKSPAQELNYILKQVNLMIAKNSEIEILLMYRNEKEGRKLKTFFQKQKIKFLDLKKERFSSTPDLRAIIAYAKYWILFKKNDSEHLKQIQNLIAVKKNKIKKLEWQKISVFAEEKLITEKEALYRAKEIQGLKEETVVSAGNLLNILHEIEELDNVSLIELLTFAYKNIGLKKQWEIEDTASSDWKIENVRKYIESVEQIFNLFPEKEFIYLLNKTQNMFIKDLIDDGKINIYTSTIHNAKGREYDSVILFRFLDSILPNESSKKSKNTLLEEANLTYVATTRAKKILYYTAYENKKQIRSVFFTEMEKINKELNLKNKCSIFKKVFNFLFKKS